MKPKIVYLTWGSTPRSHGVFGSQVIAQLKATQEVFGDAEFHLISGIPIINSGVVYERLNFFKDIKRIKSQLSPIAYSLIPIYAPQHFFNATEKTFHYMHYLSHLHLANKFRELIPDIVHCRSYHAAYAAIKVREKLAIDYKIVFDARGMWPEEVALKKGMSENHADYLFLKSIEQLLISESNVTVTVSDPMNEHYLKLGANWSETIFLSALVDKNAIEPTKVSTGSTLCYVGALAENTWHKPACLHSLYTKFRSEVSGRKLIIITTSNHAEIKKVFSDIPDDEIILTSTKTPAELAVWLKQADFGALSYFNPSTVFEKSLSNSVLAVKTCEYLAAGLPVLVNNSCKGASNLVDKYGVGISYGYEMNEISLDKLTALKTEGVREIAFKLAQRLFDYKANGERYSNIYNRLLKVK